MTDARTLDFLENNGPLPVDWQAPEISAEQIAASKVARARFDAAVQNQVVHDRGDQLVMQNAPVYAELNYEHAVQAIYDHAFAEYQHKYLNGTDWGLLPVAYKVVKGAIEVAATGGFAAPSVAKEFSKLKSSLSKLDSLGNLRKGAADAEKLLDDAKGKVADVKIAFTAPDLQGDELVAVYHAADQLLSDPAITNAHQVIANTQALALGGNVDAQRGAVILAQVASARATGRVPFGQPMLPVHSAQEAALVAHVIPKTVYSMTGAETASVSVIRQTWFQKVVAWFEELI